MEKRTVPIPVFTSLYTLVAVRAGLVILFLYFLKVEFFLPAFFLVILILTVETAGLWSRLGFSKLRVETKFSLYRLFPGDEIDFSVICENKKRLPVFLSWAQLLPPEFHAFDEAVDYSQEMIGSAYLGSYAAKTHQYRFTVQKRGYYKIPALNFHSRDVLGLFYRHKIREKTKRIIVYPKLILLEDNGIKPADFSGLEQDKRPFLFDPIMFVGLRDYTPDIPTRFINWKASAHQDRLLAKIIEPSASMQILIAIDAQAFIQPEPEEGLFEKALSIAASLAVWADSSRIPFGLAANVAQKEQPGSIFLPVNRNLDQGRLVLESLARAEFAFSGKLDDVLKDMSFHLTWGTTLVLISRNSNPVVIPSRIRRVVYYPLQGA